MSEQKPELSRVRRKRHSNKGNKLLNWMIAIVVLLIVLVGVKILSSDSSPEENDVAVTETKPEDETASTEDSSKVVTDDEEGDQSTDSKDEDSSKEGTVKDESSDSEDESKPTAEEKKGQSHIPLVKMQWWRKQSLIPLGSL